MTGKFQSIAEQNIQKTFEVLFEEAQSGNMQAIKMIMDRVVPASKAVELGEVSSKGLTVEIHIGNLEESPLVSGEIVEEGEFEEVEDGEV